MTHSMNGSNVWGSLAPFGDILSCSNRIFIRKITSFHEVKNNSCTNNEIKKIPNDTWHLFFSTRAICRLSSIMTVLKGKYS